MIGLDNAGRRDDERAAAYRASGAWQGRTLADDARRRAETDGDRPVFLGEGKPTTYGSLLADATALGAGLHRLGLRQGDVVSFMIPNWPEAAVINLASVLMGYIVNPIVPIYREAETRYILRDCKSRVIFAPGVFRGFDYAGMLDSLRSDAPDLRRVATVREASAGVDSYEALLAFGRGLVPPIPRVNPESTKMIIYTSGTTGAPKAVLHSHDTLARAVQASALAWEIAAGDVVLMPSPVTHVSGYSNGLERPFLGGTSTVLMESWNADTAVDLIDRYGVSMSVAATPFLQELITAAQRRGSTMPSLRRFACGGASVPPDLIRAANTGFTHPFAFRVYGSSEAPFVTLGFSGDADFELAADTDGQVVDYEARIVDDRGRDVPEGEIIVRGPALFQGYGEPEQTRASLSPDGYFRTGDIGRFTARGGLVITGRKKDLIIRGGENISAREVEEALQAHPDVIEAAVVAIAHPRLGEGVGAFLIARDGGRPTVQDLSSFLSRAGLARQKHPERVEIVPDLPRTASGKVRKDQLRARFASSEAAPTSESRSVE